MKAIVPALVLLFGAAPAISQECSAVLSQGIYDVRSTEVDLTTSSSYSHWFCDKKFSSSEQADNFGASLAFPFKGLPVKFGFDSNSQNYSQWQSSFCANITQDQSLQNKVREHVQSINSSVLKAFNQCLEANGLHMWLERSPDPLVFKFAARWIAPDTERDPTTTITAFRFGANVQCEERPRKVSNSEFRTRCVRKNDAAVVAAVNARPGPIRGGGSLTLPAISRPPVSQPLPPGPGLACTDATSTVRALYRLILEREPDHPNELGHVARLTSGAANVRQLVGDFVQSPEHIERFARNRPGDEQVRFLYKHVLAREGEPDGIAHNTGTLTATNYSAVSQAFVNSKEYDLAFGNRVVPGNPPAIKYCN